MHRLYKLHRACGVHRVHELPRVLGSTHPAPSRAQSHLAPSERCREEQGGTWPLPSPPWRHPSVRELRARLIPALALEPPSPVLPSGSALTEAPGLTGGHRMGRQRPCGGADPRGTGARQDAELWQPLQGISWLWGRKSTCPPDTPLEPLPGTGPPQQRCKEGVAVGAVLRRGVSGTTQQPSAKARPGGGTGRCVTPRKRRMGGKSTVRKAARAGSRWVRKMPATESTSTALPRMSRAGGTWSCSTKRGRSRTKRKRKVKQSRSSKAAVRLKKRNLQNSQRKLWRVARMLPAPACSWLAHACLLCLGEVETGLGPQPAWGCPRQQWGQRCRVTAPLGQSLGSRHQGGQGCPHPPLTQTGHH